MAETADDPELYWVDPVRRGILPLDGFHLSHRLARTVRSDRFEVSCDTAFTAVIRACAEPSEDRPQTWINSEIVSVYSELHAQGFAHSIETRSNGVLVGGLYGVSIGGAFFGESMFSRTTDASKVALAHLVARLKTGGYRLLDTQFVTEHLTSLGAREIPRAQYRRMLKEALEATAYFPLEPLAGAGVCSVLQSSTLTS
jgi:leucyl/phenylalanyl-tRNA--protein transferase